MTQVNGGDQQGGTQGLFSMVASDNAEVIPTDSPRGPESMWSVAANNGADTYGERVEGGAEPFAEWVDGDVAEAEDEELLDVDGAEDVLDDDSDAEASSRFAADGSEDSDPPPFGSWNERDWSDEEPAPGPFRRSPVDAVGSIFTAEPVDHLDDVVDEAEVVDDSWTIPSAAPEGSLFSNGAHLRGADGGARRPPPGGPGPSSVDDPWTVADRPWQDAGTSWWDETVHTPPSQSSPTHTAPSQPTGPQPTGPRATTRDPAGSASSSRSGFSHGDGEPAEDGDPSGYDTAILRLHPLDRERAHVPLTVCGALLGEDEVVLGVVTGQMLGRPAAVVVTEERVLVVNDRRWQPVVDTFPIDDQLVVRGRHDRHVAALSFADPTRVSMVDGISEVGIAIELAGHIRDAGPRGAS